MTTDNFIVLEKDFGYGIEGHILQGSSTEFVADTLTVIAYFSDRYILGTDHVERDEFDKLRAKLDSGELVGRQVYGYVHSGATVSVTPTVPSGGVSGIAYIPDEDFYGEFAGFKDAALEHIDNGVTLFNDWLNDNIYDIHVGNFSLCGIYGYAPALKIFDALGKMMAKEACEKQAIEKAEREYWEARDVCTSSTI